MTTQKKNQSSLASHPGSPSVLKQLRRFTPSCGVSFANALQVAERQAVALRRALGVGAAGITAGHIQALPRIEVCYADIAVSGTSHWTGKSWLITLSQHENPARQRFTLLHELKHIIDHGHAHQLYTGSRTHTSPVQAELAADYFAGCALVPRRELKAAWGNGIQRPDLLAALFGVSQAAVLVRLSQTGLDQPSDQTPTTARCARPIHTPRRAPQRFRIARPHRLTTGAAL